VLLASCATTQGFHEVDSPSYWWAAMRGECGHTVVVDVEGIVWGEKSCDTGLESLTRRRKLDSSEHQQIKQAFAALPQGGTPANDKRCTETEHTLRLRTKPDDDVVWLLCVPGADEWNAKAVPEPYRRVIELLAAANRE
jgi:hypothetical protein